jgi:hypothetical protein
VSQSLGVCIKTFCSWYLVVGELAKMIEEVAHRVLLIHVGIYVGVLKVTLRGFIEWHILVILALLAGP